MEGHGREVAESYERKVERMSFLIGRKVPYRPSQCPGCELLSGGESISDSRCYGFAVQDGFGRLLAEFSGESSQTCPEYKPRSGRQELEKFASSVKRMKYTAREFVRMGADEPNKDKGAICYFRAEEVGTDDIVLGETIRANLDYCARKGIDTAFLRQLYDQVDVQQGGLDVTETYLKDKPTVTEPQQEEFRRAYARRHRLIIACNVVGGVALLGLVVMQFMDFRGTFLGISMSSTLMYAILMGLAVVASVIALWKWRCPACNKWLGQTLSLDVCPRCDVAFSRISSSAVSITTPRK